MKKNNYFITIADLPPSPFDDERVSWYKDLFNTFILTEDNVKFEKDGTLSDKYKEAIKNLKKHNIDVFIRNMYNDPDYFSNEAEKEGSNYGTPYILSKRHVTNEFLEFDNVTGFYMADEAFMKPFHINEKFANFDELTKLVEFKNTYYPNHFFHMNMVPSSSYDHYYFAKEDGSMLTYRDFIQYYIDVIVSKVNGPKSICLDNYPFIHEDYLSFSYLDDLLLLSNMTRDYNLSHDDKATYGICIQTFKAKVIENPKEKRDIVSSKEVSFQLFVGITLGARLFEYFCFRPFEIDGQGILDNQGNKRIFDLVKEANDIALPFGEHLDGYTYQGAFFIRNPNPYYAYKSHLSTDKFIKIPSYINNIETDGDILCGYFLKEGKKLLVITNFSDPIKVRTVHATINFKNNLPIRLIKPLSTNIDSDSNTVSFEIPCGEAVIIEEI